MNALYLATRNNVIVAGLAMMRTLAAAVSAIGILGNINGNLAICCDDVMATLALVAATRENAKPACIGPSSRYWFICSNTYRNVATATPSI